MAAFLAIGTNNQVSWWRVSGGGALAGTAICGMHYLGNASISNYVCVYNIANVVGSALIAVAASIVALAIFFVFRAAWTHSWWKRAMSAVLLAGAVSGMHWCASTGTTYKLVSMNAGTNQLSRNATLIVVICLVSLSTLLPISLTLGLSRADVDSRSVPVLSWREQPGTVLELSDDTPTKRNRLSWQLQCLTDMGECWSVRTACYQASASRRPLSKSRHRIPSPRPTLYSIGCSASRATGIASRRSSLA